MDVRQAQSNDSIAKLVESIPRQLKPISLSKVDFPKKRRKKKKTSRRTRKNKKGKKSYFNR